MVGDVGHTITPLYMTLIVTRIFFETYYMSRGDEAQRVLRETNHGVAASNKRVTLICSR